MDIFRHGDDAPISLGGSSFPALATMLSKYTSLTGFLLVQCCLGDPSASAGLDGRDGVLHYSIRAFRGRHGAKYLGDLSRDQARMTWAEEPGSINGTTYSVIVVEWKHHPSNLFRDQDRVRAYGNTAERGVASAQFASPFPQSNWNTSIPPFHIGHPEGVDKKIRVVHLTDFVLQDEGINDFQVRGSKQKANNLETLQLFVLSKK